MDAKEGEWPTLILHSCTAQGFGSLDHARAVEQMKVINSIMQFYFGAENWPSARDGRRSGVGVNSAEQVIGKEE